MVVPVAPGPDKHYKLHILSTYFVTPSCCCFALTLPSPLLIPLGISNQARKLCFARLNLNSPSLTQAQDEGRRPIPITLCICSTRHPQLSLSERTDYTERDSLWIRIENAASFFILDLKERKAEQKKGRRRVKCNNVSYCRQRRGQNKRQQEQKNNTRDSNVVPHRSTNLARQCLTSLSRREAVLSLWYGRSCRIGTLQTL